MFHHKGSTSELAGCTFCRIQTALCICCRVVRACLIVSCSSGWLRFHCTSCPWGNRTSCTLVLEAVHETPGLWRSGTSKPAAGSCRASDLREVPASDEPTAYFELREVLRPYILRKTCLTTGNGSAFPLRWNDASTMASTAQLKFREAQRFVCFRCLSHIGIKMKDYNLLG